MKKIFTAVVLLLGMTACMNSMHNKPLAGTMWKLSKMAGIPASAIDAEVQNFTLMLTTEGMAVNGRTNCNTFFGRYELKGSEIDFEDMGMTRMACPDMQYEDMFVKMLDEADRFEVKGTELMLYDDHRMLASFKAVEIPAKK